jgi:pimeloyl-ACP methyl ester carboxylesterase
MTTPRCAFLAGVLAGAGALFGCATGLVGGVPAAAAAPPRAEPAVARFDARLTGYPYPYPVAFYRFTAQGQELEMAYMDVRPAGGGDGRGAVLLLHGKNFSGAYWRPTIAALVREGYRVIVPDQIGFGKSSKPRRFQFTFQALALYTRDLLDHAGVRDVAVVGHSMGGMLAVRFSLMFPARARRLVLMNPIGLEDWKRVVPYRPISWWYARERSRTAEDYRDYMTKSYFGGVWKASYEPLIEILAGWARSPARDLVAWSSALTSDMVFTQPVVYELADLSMPTLLIIGQRDRTAIGKQLVPPAVAAKLGHYPELGRRAAAAIPRAELVEIEGVGHIPQVEAFDRTIGALRSFLAGSPATGARRRAPAPR